MADRDIPGLHLQKVYTAPDGNLSRHYVEVEDNGVMQDANDKIFVAPLPQGMEIHNVTMVVTEALASGVDWDVGVEQKGTGTFTDDQDLFFNNQSVATAATVHSIESTRHKPFRVSDPDVFLTVQTNDDIAANDDYAVGFYIDYIYVGNL